jgi:hypothetical protein
MSSELENDLRAYLTEQQKILNKRLADESNSVFGSCEFTSHNAFVSALLSYQPSD